ncbi:hypothetical protein Q4610_00500 [Sphingobium sp. HBC34]|uniref:Uncharacterized protein n=1 Tax=Sphingobium cyanobacteriorum TaxID=3063954 RepID=A0ABT8ZIZ4_9SPHN|nr:hypothetical protein [Sphingobium sp. HBC34]MDO7833516.1 hypothetical protein [Sphingobium sp. HBC34]
MRAAFDSAVPLWQGARRFAGDLVAPRDFTFMVSKKEQAGHGEG